MAPLPLAAEALTHARGNAVQGCGMRLTAGETRRGTDSVWVDLSVNVYRRGIALVQAIAYEIAPPRYEETSRPQRLRVQRAWVKPESAAGTTRLGENTEALETLVYGLTLDDAAALFAAVAAGDPIAVGVRAWGRPRETLIAGRVTLNDDTRARIADCLNALVN